MRVQPTYQGSIVQPAQTQTCPERSFNKMQTSINWEISVSITSSLFYLAAHICLLSLSEPRADYKEKWKTIKSHGFFPVQ